MKFPSLPLAALALILFMLPSAAQLAEVDRPMLVAGELLVQFRASATDTQRRRVLLMHGLQLLRTLRAQGILHLRVPPGIDPRALAMRLRALPEIDAAEPNYYRYLDALPNDPRVSEMWALHNVGQTGGVADADIDASEAWSIATGSPTVVVAVIDSGIDLNHPDLAANLYSNPGETLNGADDDGNGFVDDVHGWNFVNDNNDPTDPNPLCSSHGTHTAGTIGAVGNNGIGVTGVAQRVKIMPLRAFFVRGILCTARDSDLLEALEYVKRMQVPISNNSWGGSPFSQLLAKGIAGTRSLFVTSAGNEGSNNDTTPSYPASYALENIISVAATNDRDALSSFSNFGVNSVHLAAPGEQILSTTRGGNYGLLSGTSMAAPHVAGAAAVLLGRDPTLTPHELRAKLMRSTDFKGLPVATGGRLNLFNALSLPPSPVAIKVTPMGSTELVPGATTLYSVTVQNTSQSAQVVTATVRAWAPGGSELVLEGPRSIVLPAGQQGTQQFAAVIPANAPPGTYRLVARVDNGSNIFDEDQAIYVLK